MSISINNTAGFIIFIEDVLQYVITHSGDYPIKRTRLLSFLYDTLLSTVQHPTKIKSVHQ